MSSTKPISAEREALERRRRDVESQIEDARGGVNGKS